MIQYTIHEVAALLNISTDAIRLYEKEGLVTPTRNPENGYRYYSYRQSSELETVLMLRELERGLSTGERKMLHSAKEILISEIVLSQSCTYEDVEARINTALN